MRQHNGKNNGRLQLTSPYLAQRGWRSADQTKKGEAELLERQLIIKTRQGGLNIGPSRYAVTWLTITNFVGLDISSKDYHPGAYRLLDSLPVRGSASSNIKRKTPEIRRNAIKRTVVRNGGVSSDRSVPQTDAVPYSGTPKSLVIPCDGSKGAVSRQVAVPYHGNNEYCQLPTAPLLKRSPVVGAIGRSGKPKPKPTHANEG